MHGLGNDFVIIDERNSPMQLVSLEQREEVVRAIANRTTGVGCDQLIVLRASGRADAYMQIYNADGSEVGACGNATRCVAWALMREKRADAALIDTEAGLLEAQLAGKGLVNVNMGLPRLGWEEIPLSEKEDTLHVALEAGMLKDPVCVSMGNPHAVFFVEEVGAVPLKKLGPELETCDLFPERANIGIAQIDSDDHMTLRVWERGVGETQACGTGACAAVVAARRRAEVDATVTVQLLGGELTIQWNGTESDPEHPVWMTGPVAHSFSGELTDDQWV